MLTIDYYSGFVFLLSLLFLTSFVWHSNRVLQHAGSSGSYRQKDTDDYVLGKRYNEHISALDGDLKITRDRIVSFLGIWKVLFFCYFMVCTATLYAGYISHIQIEDRVTDLEKRVLVLEKKCRNFE